MLTFQCDVGCIPHVSLFIECKRYHLCMNRASMDCESLNRESLDRVS